MGQRCQGGQREGVEVQEAGESAGGHGGITAAVGVEKAAGGKSETESR